MSVDALIAERRLERLNATPERVRGLADVAQQHLDSIGLLIPQFGLGGSVLVLAVMAGRRALVAAAAANGYAVVVAGGASEDALEEALLAAAAGASPVLDALVPAYQNAVETDERTALALPVARERVEEILDLARQMVDAAHALAR